DRIARNYTSARLLTQGKFARRFGRFEARIKLPFGQGVWPAFWMLGENITSVGWPACGEIDVMENIGREPSLNHGSLHGPGYSGGNSLTASFGLPDQGHFSDDFHIFALEWSPNSVKFFVDGAVYESRSPSDVPSDGTWVFDTPFFVLLNLAVGGSWPGSPDQTTVFPQTMLVDYVRVYSDPDLDRTPLIASAVISAKNGVVRGDGFVAGSTIVMDGEPRTTKVPSPNMLNGKKLAKKISHGQTVSIQVNNPDGSKSNVVSLTRR